MNFDFSDVLLEADDEEKKEDEKKEEKKDEEKEDKSKEDDKKEDKSKEDKDDDINDIMADSDSDNNDSDDIDSSDLESSGDDESGDSDEMNDLIGDDDADFLSSDDDETSDSDEMNDLIGDGDTEVSAVVVTTSAGDGNVYEKIAKLGYLYVVIANNMKHIHLNCSGRKFNEIHKDSEEYYYHFGGLSDKWFEVAAESPLTKLDNPTRAKEHVEDIEVESKEDYTFVDAFAAISSNFNKAIDYCKEVREAAGDARSDIQSSIDEELTYLNKHYGFILRKKMIPEAASSDFAANAVTSNESFNWLF